jgi:hypothetical protein
MKSELIRLIGLSVALAITGWMLLGNPEIHGRQPLHHDPDRIFDPERSPYMRSER